jgi:hypothetical protein
VADAAAPACVHHGHQGFHRLRFKHAVSTRTSAPPRMPSIFASSTFKSSVNSSGTITPQHRPLGCSCLRMPMRTGVTFRHQNERSPAGTRLDRQKRFPCHPNKAYSSPNLPPTP